MTEGNEIRCCNPSIRGVTLLIVVFLFYGDSACGGAQPAGFGHLRRG